jgi:hypothetical protein
MGNEHAHKRACLLKKLRKDKQVIFWNRGSSTGTDALHPHNSKCSLLIMYATSHEKNLIIPKHRTLAMAQCC